MRNFSECRRGEKCINPRQGALTQEDYHTAKGNIGGKTYCCKMCEVEKHRKIRRSDYAAKVMAWDIDLANLVITGKYNGQHQTN